jgi:tRNA threonylcarbamoyladenosine biosynthesis protein TsaE
MLDSTITEPITVHNLDEMQAFATQFISELKTKSWNQKAAVVGLSGQLGAGKTTFVQAAARGLGVEEVVNSPTFIILKRYSFKNQPWDNLIHIDAYRLEGGEELLSLGWDEIVNDAKNLIMVEWVEKVSEIMPPFCVRVNFHVVGEGVRTIIQE